MKTENISEELIDDIQLEETESPQAQEAEPAGKGKKGKKTKAKKTPKAKKTKKGKKGKKEEGADNPSQAIKKTKRRRDDGLPSSDQLKAELHRIRYKKTYRSALRSTVYTLITVAAIAILTATLWLPVLQIYGTSMEPTLFEGNIVVSVKGNSFNTGEIIAFYYNNKILVKRVIGSSGDWVDIDLDGTVYVNNEEIIEPYISEKAYGDCDIRLPYQVPDGRVFVMGDHRSVSVDSRSSSVGCVAEEQIVGKLVFCVWPIDAFGYI